MGTHKIYEKRIDEEGNEVMVLIDEIPVKETPPTPSEFLNTLSEEQQLAIARIMGYGLK